MNREILKTVIALIFLTTVAYSQPATEIYLFDLSWNDGKMTISNPVNISNHPGYDNQPFFHPDKTLIYFASANADGRTDIMTYDYTTAETKKLTDTPEREYSPTVTPDKKFISCIVQRDNGAQDLCKYPINGGAPVVLINTLKIGYHAWADENNVMLFVLGDEVNTLHWYTLRPARDIQLMEGIGRSLHRIPGTKSISFVHKFSDEYWVIKKIQEEDGNVVTITETLPDREDLTWTPDGRIVMSEEKKIFFFDPKKGKMWVEAEIQSTVPVTSISRLAVSPAGDKIAVVMNE